VKTYAAKAAGHTSHQPSRAGTAQLADPRRLGAFQDMADRSPQVRAATQLQAAADNRTGMPDALKAGLEGLSGLDMSDVTVHFNSPRPAALQAAAYTQGTDIHLAPGQEKHLPHEAWHVVQQKQGRVRATAQMKGVDLNDDEALEQEADRMGPAALRSAGAPRRASLEAKAPRGAPVVQGLFDWARNLGHNRRKVGVEITEGNANGNGISELAPTGAWAALAAPARNALWTHTVNLTNAAGAAQAWHVAHAPTLVPAHFQTTNGNKNVWMRWGTVALTEDYGDFEWITQHPAAPQGVAHYRNQLAAVNTARQLLRNRLNALPIANPFVMALNTNPALGQVFQIDIQPGANAASAQITVESTNRARTKQGLLEGLTHGLDKLNVPNRASLVGPEQTISTAVTTAANRVAYAGADMELIMAYLIGDVCHKIATLITGPNWAGAIAANFKQWRTLFPKSHPSQIMRQAMNAPVTALNAGALNAAIAGQTAAIVGDIVALYAAKMREVNVLWQPGHFAGAADPHGHIQGGIGPGGVVPAGGQAALQASLVTFCTQNGLNITTEFTRALTALTDPTAVAVDVVRSTGFAQHAPNTTGFAFEDRAEVQTQFPGLSSTYARIKRIVDRY
jgi:hypothetical protein